MENQNALADYSSNKAIDSIVVSAQDLTEILNQETACLKAADTKGFKALHDQKTEFTQRYEAQFTKLIANKEQLKGAPVSELERLQEARKNVINASKENLEALKRTNKSLNRLSERILNLARENQQASTATYSSKGSLYTNDKRPISVGLIETV